MSCFQADCANVTAPVNFQALLSVEADKMDAGIQTFGLIHKDCTFTDIYDPTEWEAKKASGEIDMGPCGIVNLGNPSFATSPDGCGGTEIDRTTYNPSFTVRKLDATALTHIFYMICLMEDTDCFNVFFCDCNQNIILNYNWMRYLHGKTTDVPDECPGIPFTISQAPTRGSTSNDILDYTIAFEVRYAGRKFMGESLLPGVCAALA